MKDDVEAEPVLVSACLLGRLCRYDGRHDHDRVLEDELRERGFELVPFCPEEHGQLGTPRPAAWIESGDAAAVVDGRARMIDKHGRDVSAAFLDGARGALELCRARGIRRAFLKERSPSCGVCNTHVDDVLVDGPGVTTELLVRAGIACEGSAGRRNDDQE